MASQPTVVVRSRGRTLTQEVEAGRHRFSADEPVAAGGADAGPSPYDFLLAALGTCTSMTLRLYADRKGWPLEDVVVRLRHDKIHADECAECETREGLVDRIQREIELIGSLDVVQRDRLLDIASKCPVHRSLVTETQIVTRLLDVS